MLLADVKLVFEAPLPPVLVAIGALAVVAAIMLLVRRDARSASPRVRRAIVALTLTAALLVVMIVLSPVLIRTWRDPQKPALVVLVDSSRSMLMPHNTGERSRFAVARDLLSGDGSNWLSTVEQDFAVSFAHFSKSLQTLAVGTAPATTLGVDAEGFATALGESLEQAALRPAATQPRAIVLLSDGAWNSGRDPAAVAQRLGQLAVPVFAVGVGQVEPPTDAAVLAVKAPERSLLGDEIVVTARIALSGASLASPNAELLIDGAVVQQRPVKLSALAGNTANATTGGGGEVQFSITPERPGSLVLAVRIPAMEGEHDTANNMAAATVEVVEQKMRVLMVEAEPRWEFRFIRSVFERDPSLEVDICLLRPSVGPATGPGYLATPPTTRDELAKYHLIVLGDIDYALLSEGFATELAALVRQRGAALAVIAGRRGGYLSLTGSALEPILPVRLGGSSALAMAAGEPFQPRLTAEGAAHLATRLAPSVEANSDTWAALPELHWCASLAGIAPGAQALLEHPFRLAGTSRLPILAWHRVGRGKVLFSGTEDTWRWRKSIGDRYHYRFWAQLTRWLVRQQFVGGDERARIALDRADAAPGDAVGIEVFCLDRDGFPLRDAQVMALVELQGGGGAARVALEPEPGGWGLYSGRFTPEKLGTYEVRPVVSAFGATPLESVAQLHVAPRDLERYYLAQDRQTLDAVAQASGGRYLSPEQIDELPALLASRSERALITAEFAPFRHWACYGVLVGLLGANWLIRKRSGLA